MCGTPTLFYHLCRIAKRQPKQLPLKTVVLSGECITNIVAETIQEVLPNINIYNVYGLTEASPRVSYLPPNKFDNNPLSVGIPLKSLKIKIKNKELLIKGKSIMKGYYNDIKQTQKILKDGWLYTGDIAKIDDKGFITIIGRKDNLIIRSGMNIYPQEIENTLKKEEDITEVLAYGAKDTKGNQKIFLQLVTELSKIQVLEICRNKLPSYQFPDSIEIVKALPKNASGKLIRNYF